jgi:four helix bundle protein
VAKISSYRDLLVWQQAMELAAAVYDSSRDWPREELYGLTTQARRAAVSIAANIAEGYGRESRGSYIQFLCTAQGSVKELETHLLIAERIGIVEAEIIEQLLERCESVGKLLRLLVRKLETGT